MSCYHFYMFALSITLQPLLFLLCYTIPYLHSFHLHFEFSHRSLRLKSRPSFPFCADFFSECSTCSYSCCQVYRSKATTNFHKYERSFSKRQSLIFFTINVNFLLLSLQPVMKSISELKGSRHSHTPQGSMIDVFIKKSPPRKLSQPPVVSTEQMLHMVSSSIKTQKVAVRLYI